MQSLKLDQELAQVLVVGMKKTLQTMFRVSAIDQPFRVEEHPLSEAPISGIVEIFQEKNEGTLRISFERETIFHILGSLYRRKFTDIDKCVKDGVGEITNVLYGALKKNLNDSGCSYRQAIPVVVVQGELPASNFAQGKSLIIPFHTAAGDLRVEISLKQ